MYRHGIGPAVRALLDTYGLQVKDVKPSGPHGTLLKGFVFDYRFNYVCSCTCFKVFRLVVNLIFNCWYC